MARAERSGGRPGFRIVYFTLYCDHYYDYYTLYVDHHYVFYTLYVDHKYDYDETNWATINMITLMMKNTIMITTRVLKNTKSITNYFF